MTENGANESSFTIIWKVENYSLTLDNGWRTSPESIPHCPYNCKLSVERIGLENIFSVSYYCNLLNGLVLSLLGSDGSVLVKEEKRYTTPKSSREQLTLKCDQLFGERREEFLPGDVLTLQCCIWKNDGKRKSDTLYLNSQLGEFSSSFIWAIRKFSSFLPSQKRDLKISGGNQPFQSLDLTAFCDNRESLSVCMNPILQGSQSIQSTLQVSILDCNKKVIESKKDERVMFTNVSSAQKLEFMCLRSRLMDNKDVNLPGDVLYLQCDLILKGILMHHYFSYDGSMDLMEVKSEGNSFQKGGIYQEKNPECSGRQFQFKRETSEMTTPCRRDDFKAMFEEKILFDFSLRTGTESFPVHKVVLSARSRVFRTMFEGDMKEAREHFMEIEDVDVNTMRRFLLFLYTDELQEDLECQDLVNLYYVADKYQVLALTDRCSFLLKGVLSVDNVYDVLILADMHTTDEYLNVAIREFVEKHDKEIVSSDKWKIFESENLALAVKIMREIFLKCKK